MTSEHTLPLMKTIRDDFLTCKICFNIYDQPKILPCVHTYCSPCLDKLFKTSAKPGSITCPECRELVNLPNGTVSDLKTNFLINGFIAVIKVKKNTDVKCTVCKLRGICTRFAICRCLNCGDYLCESCSDGHNASSTTWKHKHVLLKDIKGGTYDKELRNLNSLNCPQHKDNGIEYFCETCHVPICMACILFKHHDHTYVTATEVVKTLKTRLIKNSKKVKEKLFQLKTEKTMACETLANMSNWESQAITCIEEQIERILMQMESHKDNALKWVDSMMKDEIKHCTSQVEKTNLKLTLATDCLEFCEKMIEQGEDEEVLYLEETITKRLLQLEKTSFVVVPRAVREELPDIGVEQTHKVQDAKFSIKKQTDDVHSLPKKKKIVVRQKVSFQLLRTFDTHYVSDKIHPMVKGITINNKTIILSDCVNGKIKRITTCGTLKECFTTDDSFAPFAIAVCNNIIGAIHENYLYMFDQNGKLAHTVTLLSKWNTYPDLQFSFALDNYKNEGFIVGILPRDELRVYATDGSLLKRIVVPLFYPLANLSVDQSGRLITCEWGDYSVRVRTLDGKTITYCKIPHFKKAIVAHEDKNGLIYAVDNLASTVYVFDKNGTLLYQYSTKEDGLLKPRDLAFDEEGLMYLVNNLGNINVYKIIVKNIAIAAPNKLDHATSSVRHYQSQLNLNLSH